jgi:hypothetical protein
LAASILFAIGLFPAYVSALIVEKRYTAFWTGFWNLYGLFVTSVGLAIDNYNPWGVWGLFALAVFIVFVVYLVLFEAEGRNATSDLRRAQAAFTRRLGASWVATSLNWGLFVGFTAGLGWGILVTVIHGVIMFLILVAVTD